MRRGERVGPKQREMGRNEEEWGVVRSVFEKNFEISIETSTRKAGYPRRC